MSFFFQLLALFLWITLAVWVPYFLLFIVMDSSREIEDERRRTLRSNIIFGASVGVLAFITTLPWL